MTRYHHSLAHWFETGTRKAVFAIGIAILFMAVPVHAGGLKPGVLEKLRKLGWREDKETTAEFSLRLPLRARPVKEAEAMNPEWESLKGFSRKIEGMPAAESQKLGKLDPAAWAKDIEVIRKIGLSRFGFKDWQVDKSSLQRSSGRSEDSSYAAIELVGSYLDADGAEQTFVEWHVLQSGQYRQLIWGVPGRYFYEKKVEALRILFDEILKENGS